MKYLYVGFALLLVSCTSLTQQRETYIAYYQAGEIETSECLLDQTIEKEVPEDNYTKSYDSVLLISDRAILNFQRGKTKEALEDFNLALDALDYYRNTTLIDTVAQILSEDINCPFTGDDYEQLLIRLYFAFTLIHEGDYSNAYAILRQAEEWSQDRQALYQHSPVTASLKVYENPLAKYVFATLLEKRGDLSNAEILYRQAECLSQGEFPVPEMDPSKATFLFVNHNGNAPFRYTEFTDASQVSLLALEFFLNASHDTFAISSIYGLPTPALAYYPESYPIRTCVRLNQNILPLKPIFSVDFAAQRELQEKMPIVVARGAARFILRRSMVAYAGRQDPALGLACDVGMLIANARTEADTRSLSFLPRQYELARVNLDSGCYFIEIEVWTPFGPGIYKTKLNIPKNELVVIHQFNIHPGISRVLIPSRYLENP
jgi:hypothetical protein